jgi:phosphopantothenoylcysteine synthetase/decarboxylase
MNTEMWTNLATSEHLQQLRRVYQSMKMVEPIEALLACGDKGIGAMARIETIVETVNSFE